MSSLIAIWLMGFVGSAHCVAMCGGISSSLSVASSNNTKKQDKDIIPVNLQSRLDENPSIVTNNISNHSVQPKKQMFLSMFNMGRIISYMLAGLLVGLIGLFSNDVLTNSAEINIPRLVSAVFIMLVAFYIVDFKSSLAWVEKLGHGLWRFIQPISRILLPVKSIQQAFGLGLIWGWLPCGMVYSALVLSATSSSPLSGVLHMLAFGIGTLPSMLAVGYLSQELTRWKKLKTVRLIMFLTMIVCSLWTAYLAIPQLQQSNQSVHQHHQ
jgi:uncharacterized protein